jgi:hypothetical protein
MLPPKELWLAAVPPSFIEGSLSCRIKWPLLLLPWALLLFWKVLLF